MRILGLVVVLAACGGGRESDDGEVYVETTLEECGVDDTLLAMLACGQTELQWENCVGAGEACDRYLHGGVNDYDCIAEIPGYSDGAVEDASETCRQLAPVALEVMDCEGVTNLWPADPWTYDCPCEMSLPYTDEGAADYNRCIAAH